MKISTSNSIKLFVLIVLVLFIPLYPKFPLEEVFGTYIKIRMEDILVAVVGVIWLIFNFKDLKKIIKQPITQIFLLFWGVGLLSVISALFITHSASPHLGLLHWLRRVEYMSLFFVAASFIQSKQNLKFFLKAMLVATVIICLYGFGQKYLQFPVISTTNKEFSKGLILTLTNNARPNSTFAGHYDLAAYLSIVLVFLGSFFLYYQKTREKIIVALSGLLAFALLGLTEARTSFVSALGGLTVIFWLSGKKWLIIVLMVASLGAVAIIPGLRHRLVATITVNILGGGGAKYVAPRDEVTIFSRDGTVSEASKAAAIDKMLRESTQSATQPAKVSTISADIAPGEPVNPTELGVSRSFNIRFDVEWPRALNAFYKNPIIGTGYSSLGDATDNDFLRALGETGLLGFLALALVFIAIGKRILHSLPNVEKFERAFLIGAFASIVVLLATGIFIDVLEASKIAYLFWIIMGIAWAVTNDYNFTDDK